MIDSDTAGRGQCALRWGSHRIGLVLATAAGLFIGVAMFGTLAYLPTYLQMVTKQAQSPVAAPDSLSGQGTS